MTCRPRDRDRRAHRTRNAHTHLHIAPWMRAGRGNPPCLVWSLAVYCWSQSGIDPPSRSPLPIAVAAGAPLTCCPSPPRLHMQAVITEMMCELIEEIGVEVRPAPPRCPPLPLGSLSASDLRSQESMGNGGRRNGTQHTFLVAFLVAGRVWLGVYAGRRPSAVAKGWQQGHASAASAGIFESVHIAPRHAAVAPRVHAMRARNCATTAVQRACHTTRRLTPIACQPSCLRSPCGLATRS